MALAVVVRDSVTWEGEELGDGVGVGVGVRVADWDLEGWIAAWVVGGRAVSKTANTTATAMAATLGILGVVIWCS